MAGTSRVTVVAGPNGAGKTTFVREYLPAEMGSLNFVNADLIAQGLSPFAPEAAAIKAGRLMLAEIQGHVRKGDTFAFETTLSGRGYARLIPEWQAAGYHVSLIFLRLPSADMAIERVRGRVRKGGHHIPEDVVRRRFAGGLRNLESLYKPLVDEWFVYDSAGVVPLLLDQEVNHG